MVLINIILGFSVRGSTFRVLSLSYPRSGNYSDRIPECWHNPGIIFWAALVNFLQSEIICLRFLYKSPSVKVSRSNLQTVSLFLLFSNSLLFYFCFDVLSSLVASPTPFPPRSKCSLFSPALFDCWLRLGHHYVKNNYYSRQEFSWKFRFNREKKELGEPSSSGCEIRCSAVMWA